MALPMNGAMRLFGLAVGLCVSVSAPLYAQEPSAAQNDLIPGLQLPVQIAGARRGDITDFEKSEPGLGYGVRYQLPGWTTDIYFYDLEQPSIPKDATSDVVKVELEQAKADVFEAGRRGLYGNVLAKGDYAIADSAGRRRFVCSTLAYFHTATMTDVDSYLCVTGWKEKYVKIRMTTPHSDTSAARSRRFIEAWIGVLWPRL